MTQNGIVTKLLDNDRAEVAVERGTACGGHCSGGCDACVYASKLLVSAENCVFAAPGDKVVLESRTSSIMGATLLIYMLPVLCFFIGCTVSVLCAMTQELCVMVSLLGALIGTVLSVFFGRRKKAITFQITGFSR